MEILIVEDELKIARFLELELEHEGYKTKHVATGRAALDEALARDYALVILDLMLPGLNGLEVLRRLRQVKNTPVIILTARDQIMDKVSGLDIGADDYMTKPFQIEELLARIRAHLRKKESTAASNLLQVGALRLDHDAYEVSYDGNPIEVTKKEFDLLAYLMENKNVVVTREKALDAVWGYDFYGNTNVVDVYIRYLRSKIDDVYGVKIIQTVRCAGYVIKTQ